MQLFTTKYDEILKKVDSINPIKYAVTRNFKNGHVTKLSPYISRGVISTKFIYEKLVEKGFNLKKCEKFIQELAWRDFWQQIWLDKGSLINEDLKRPQEDINDYTATAINSSGDYGKWFVIIRPMHGFLIHKFFLIITHLYCDSGVSQLLFIVPTS